MKPHRNTKHFWSLFHRWTGLLVSVFILIFCVSGIILNHRDVFGGAEVSRSILPASYKIRNFNNGIIKGSLALDNDSILAFGTCGVWLTDTGLDSFADFNRGLPDGVDNRNIRNIVRTKAGELWCAAQYGLYRYAAGKWCPIELSDNSERFSDVCITPDSTAIVAVTRSKIYRLSPDGTFRQSELPAPDGYRKEVPLFKTVWQLHSGELFGITGKIIVDVIAVILAFLSISGIILFILPYRIRSKVKRHMAAIRDSKAFRWNFTWHNGIGYYTLPVVFLIVFTGTCLRPPLMIPFVMTKTAPMPGSSLSSPNAWHDKLRALRWDENGNKWLLSTSDGFFSLDSLAAVPVPYAKKSAPPVSPMGITVFQQENNGLWLIGSFSGLYRWQPDLGVVRDYSTNEIIDLTKKRPFDLGRNIVSGYTADTKEPVVFDYARGADKPVTSDSLIEKQPMSLWNLALELHVGRCYTPFPGPFSDLFVFLSGTLIMLILISGYIVSKKHKSHN